MIYDKIKHFDKYPYGRVWEEAFEFLSSLNKDSEERRYELSQGMFGIVMSYPTKIHADAVLESHEKYIDIQMTIEGAEGIEWFYTSDLEVKDHYDENRDVAFYHYPSRPPAVTTNYAGFFTALWPSDAHMPQLIINDIKNVKKAVVKIPIELLKQN